MRASEALASVRHGEVGPLCNLLDAWRWAGDPRCVDIAVRTLLDAHPLPPTALCGVDRIDLATVPRGATELELRKRLWSDARGGAMDPGTMDVGASDRLVWALVDLAAIGRALRGRESTWGRPPAEDPVLDSLAAATWVSLFSGRPRLPDRYVTDHLAPEAARIFSGVMSAARLPRFEGRRVRRDLAESFLPLLVGRTDGVPVWADLALRVVEAGPGGPVPRLAEQVSPAAWPTAATCLARRRQWAATLRLLWPERRDRDVRALALVGELVGAPGFFPRLLDLHLFVQTCRAWTVGGEVATSPDATDAHLRRTIARVRARLRALVAEDPQRILPLVLSVDGLHEATLAATRRLAWAWAKRELEVGFSLGSVRAAPARCRVEAMPVLAGEEREALRAWTLLVTLRGRDGWLDRWLARGTTGDHDAVWGRLLAAVQPRVPHRELRRLLLRLLPSLRRENQPALRAVAGLREGRTARAAFEAALRPSWPASIPFPERGFAVLIANARLALGEV